MNFHVYQNLAEINKLSYEAATRRFYSAYASKPFAEAMARQRPYRMISDVELAIGEQLEKNDLLNQSSGCILIQDGPQGSHSKFVLSDEVSAHLSEPRNADTTIADHDRTIGRILSSLFER